MTDTVLQLKKKNGTGVFVQVRKDLEVKLYTQEYKLILERLRREGSQERVQKDMDKLRQNQVQSLGWVTVFSSKDAEKTSDVLLDLSNKYNKSVPALLSQFIENAQDYDEWEKVVQTFLNHFASTYMGFLLPSFGVEDYITFLYNHDSAELRNNKMVAGFQPEKIQEALLEGDFGFVKEDLEEYSIGLIGLNVNTESAYRTTSAKLLLYVFQPTNPNKEITLVPVVRFGPHIIEYVEKSGLDYVHNSNELPERILGVCSDIGQAYEVMRDFMQQLQNLVFETVFPYLQDEEEE